MGWNEPRHSKLQENADSCFTSEFRLRTKSSEYGSDELMNSKSREACQRCRSLAGVRGANLRDGRTGRFLPGGVWYVAGGGTSSPNVVPPCPMPAPRLPVVSPHLHAVPFIRVPPLPFTLPSPDLTCSDGGWPLAVPAVIAMKMTPVLHRVDGLFLACAAPPSPEQGPAPARAWPAAAAATATAEAMRLWSTVQRIKEQRNRKSTKIAFRWFL